MILYSTTMKYTAPSPSLSAPYTFINTSPFRSVADYNMNTESEKVDVLFNIKGGDNTITVVLSNMANPPNDYRYAEEMLGKLEKDQFWFRLVITDLGITKLASFRVIGFERRGDMRLEIDESCSRYEYQHHYWKKLEHVSQAIDGFITFKARLPYYPDYPMPQFLPTHFEVLRCFREHCPPGYRLPGIQAPFGWLRNGDRLNLRSRPLRSQYTNELLVHPYFNPVIAMEPVPLIHNAHGRVFIAAENDDEDGERQGPRLLMPADRGETGSFFGTVPRRGDNNESDGSQF